MQFRNRIDAKPGEQKVQKLLHGTSAIVLALFILAGSAYTYLFLANDREDYDAKAASCTVDAKLVNSCRPWVAVAVGGYTMAGDNTTATQFAFFEKRLNNPNVLTSPGAATTIVKQLDFVHLYNAVGKNTLSADAKTYINRPNTYLQLNWKPTATWSLAGGGDAATNAGIDSMANSIKSVAPKKIMLSIYHEPEDNVSVGTAGSGCTTKGSAGSPTDYVNMWHNVRARFDALGVTNVVWNMNYMGYSGWNCLVNQMWPGNNYVDWLTWDPYAGGTQSFAASVQPFYNFLTSNSNASHDYLSKVWGFSEMGYWNQSGTSTETQAPIYWQQVKAAIQNNTFPKVKLYSAFDTNAASDYSASLIGLNFGTTTATPNIAEQTAYNDFASTVFALGQGIVTPPADTAGPSVAFTAPANNATVSGSSVTVSATATDTSGVNKVDFYVDNALVSSDTSGSNGWGFTLNSTTLSNAGHTLKATAVDAAGNSSTVTRAFTVNNPVANPAITSFTASPQSVIVGNTTTLNWAKTNAVSCSVNPGGPQNTTNSSWTTLTYTSAGTNTYTLVCKNSANATVSANTTVTVTPAPTPPTSVVLSASSASITSGGSVSLSWTSNNATFCTLNPGNFTASGTGSSKTITNLTATTTYQVSCSNNAGATNSNQVKVTVTQAPAPPANPSIASFTATPANIANGGTSVLAWQASNVANNGCSLAPSPLTSTASTGQWTTPALSASASYTLTCKNSANVTVSKSVSVIVANKAAPTAPPPTAPENIVSVNQSNTGSVTAPGGQQVVDTSSTGEVTQGDLATLDGSNVADQKKSDNIEKVEYYNGEKLVYTATVPPFALDTSKLPVGSVTVTQRTYFKDGSTAEESQLIEVKGAKTAAAKAPEKGNGLVVGIGASMVILVTAFVAAWWFVLRPRGYTLKAAVASVSSRFAKGQSHATTPSEDNTTDEATIIKPDKKDTDA